MPWFSASSPWRWPSAPTGERPQLQQALAEAADAAGDGGTIDLATVVDFPWDGLHVFNAYTPDDVIASELGFDGQPQSLLQGMVVGDTALAYDSLQMLVFVRGDGDVTGWRVLNLDVEQPSVGFELGDVPPALTRDGAQFMVDGPGEGWLFTPASTPQTGGERVPQFRHTPAGWALRAGIRPAASNLGTS